MEPSDEKVPMSAESLARVAAATDAIYRAESRRVFATLIRLLGDFDLAEEALHDAFRAALEQWPRDGIPANPRAWLVSAGRFKAIGGWRSYPADDPRGAVVGAARPNLFALVVSSRVEFAFSRSTS